MDHFDNNLSTVNQPINSQQNPGTDELDNQYIISDVSINYLTKMKPTSKDKDEFASVYQVAFEEHPQRTSILQEFQESYSSARALSWFNRDPIFYRILNNAFQSADIETLYRCRFFIRDIQKQFETQKCSTLIQVYRGQLIPNENLQQVKNSQGKIIAIKSFFFATVNRDTAVIYIPEQNECKRVLYDIEANPQIPGVKPFIKLGSSSDQDEVLFMLGSLFKINEIRDEENGIIIIKMSLCASENDIPFKDQLNDTNEEKDLIGFVQLQCNINHFLSNSRILHNIDKHLEKYVNEIPADHSDRIRCYDTLGNYNFAKKDFDSSLNWYQKSLEMKQKILPSNDPNLAETYNNIAFVYLHKKDNTQALNAFKQVLMIGKQIYGDDHVNLIYCYTQMSNIYEADGKFTEVLSCYFQISSIMLKHCPVDDINFAPIYNNIGKTFVSLCQYHLALGYYETSLQIKLKHLPSLSESTALTHKSMGVVYKHVGNVDQARIHLEKAAAIYRQLYSPTYEIVLEIETFIQNLSSPSQ